MKILILFIIFFAAFTIVPAQNVPGVPNGSIAKDSRDDYDNGIRIRSIELERVKNESYRSAALEKAAENRKINYSQIKSDFELVQKLQNEIVKTYVTGKQINYGRIGELAAKLNECAKRLEFNLLLYTEKTTKKSNKENLDSRNVSGLIVILDKSIGTFVANQVFKNLNIIEPNDAEKAEFDLHNIIQVSNFLAQKAEKQK